MATKELSIEQYSEATATVVSKLIAGVFRVVFGVFKGIATGLCFLPVLSGIKKAIHRELDTIDA
jgi:hypothetical protein